MRESLTKMRESLAEYPRFKTLKPKFYEYVPSSTSFVAAAAAEVECRFTLDRVSRHIAAEEEVRRHVLLLLLMLLVLLMLMRCRHERRRRCRHRCIGGQKRSAADGIRRARRGETVADFIVERSHSTVIHIVRIHLYPPVAAELNRNTALECVDE